MKNQYMPKYFRIIACVAIILTLFVCAFFIVNKVESQRAIMRLYLYGDMTEMHEKSDVRSIAAMFMNDEKRVICHATIKLQGTSSLSYDKKNYTIKFYGDHAHNNKKPIDVGWGAENEYCLKANWIDKTHSRNIVTARLATEIQAKYGVMEQAPCNGLIDGFPVEVYINNQYHGLYTWNIPKSAWQFGMDEDNPDHIVMCGEGWDDATLFYAMPNFDSWSVEVGPENEETLMKFSRLSDFILHSTDEEFKEDFDQYIDLDAMLNYFVLSEFAYMLDNFGKNMLVATYDGAVWYPSLYDLDTSWGTHYSGLELWAYQSNLTNFGETNNLANRVQTLFAQELHDRYFELREDILTKAHVLELFNEFDNSIPEDAKSREIKQWGDDIPGYDFSQIEDYLESVIDRLDEKYKKLVN